MAFDPTREEIQTQVNNHLATIEGARNYFDGTMLDDLDALVQDPEGDFLSYVIPGVVDDIRSRASEIISPEAILEIIGPALQEFGKLFNSPYGSIGDEGTYGLIDVLRENMVDNSKDVNSRNITYGTPSAGGGNTGTGACSRLTKDAGGFNLEACTPEAKTLLCRLDAGTGSLKGDERWEIRGTERSFDHLNRPNQGSGYRARMRSMSPASSILTNSSFDRAHGSTDSSVTKVSGWTIAGSGANIAESSTIFEESPGVTTANSRSLQFEASETITQTIEDAVGSRGLRNWPVPRPIFGSLRWQRLASATGTLKFRIGSQEVTVDVSTGTNGVWNELVWKTDQNCWPENFIEADLAVDIEMDTLAVGTVLVDHVIVQPWEEHDGTFWALRGGATAWKAEDTFTVTDSGGAPQDAEVQYYFQLALRDRVGWRAFLPHVNDGSETWADPA